jgi:DNA gyrase subunit A
MTTKILDVSLSKELKTSYLSYSVSIFNRALPSVVDGLKSAQRRIILGLKDLNLKPDGQYKKVSRLEGHVLGSYHPQGGCAGTAINMGQADSFRYMLTDIHGNVGGSIQSGPSIGQSISEDSPAAARYLEVKSSALTQALYVSEIDPHSCEWRENYDGSTQEVVEIVPAIPALLINGAQGIACGYACHHVSYNLSEVMKGTIEYIKNPSITTKKLFSYIKGPDLANGARILNNEKVFAAFEKGAGVIATYGTWEVKKVNYGKKSTRDAIVIKSLASGSSERFIEKLKAGVEGEKIIGVADAQDHSSRAGIEIVVVLRPNASPTEVISQLLAFTNLSDSIGVNATAISSNLPTTFGVKDIIAEWYGARKTALSKRYVAECKRLKDKIHILDGLLTILADIDAVVKVIKAAKTRELAIEGLKKKWKLSDSQAQAVLAMPLSKLVNAEKLELESQKAELESRVGVLTGIISDEAQMSAHIITQIESFKAFSDKRRSILISEDEVGGEKAKVTTKSGTRKPKLPTPKDKIKEEGKNVGMKRADLTKFFAQVAGKTNIKAEWTKFKAEWEHSQQLSTRKGKAERKTQLEELKAWAISNGMPKRGVRAWNAFMKTRESMKIEDIKSDLKEWLK